MDNLLMLFSAIACLVAAARILVLMFRQRRREKERAEADAADCIVFHEEIDDFCIANEIKQSCAFICIFLCPSAMLDVWYCSYAGIFSKAVTLVTIIAAIVYIVKTEKNRRA